MINKIIRIKNIGLLFDAVPEAPVKLEKNTIIYAENGRGKSTLTSVFRACSLNESKRVKAQKTIDSSDEPVIELLKDDGDKKQSILFSGTSWNASVPEMIVFDSEFVDQNVYSGFEVGSGQKKSLLEFALGDDAVAIKNKIIELNEKIREETKKRRDAEKKLTGFLGKLSIENFVVLAPIKKLEEKIKSAEKKLANAKRSVQIQKQPKPISIKNIEFKFDSLILLLQKEMKTLEDNAEAIVQEHLQKHSSEKTEDWLSQGQSVYEQDCPFCGQQVDDVKLIQAYQSYFSDEYNNLKKDIKRQTAEIKRVFGESSLLNTKNTIKTNKTHTESWKEHILISDIEFDIRGCETQISSIQNELLYLTNEKQNKPLDSIGTEGDFKKTEKNLDVLNQKINNYNKQVQDILEKIEVYINKIKGENVKELTDDLEILETIQKRQNPTVVSIVNSYQNAISRKKELQQEKELVRDELDSLMEKTLEKYQKRVNRLIASFHAKFAIEKMKADYRSGGNPRSNYGLVIRGNSIKLGKRDDKLTTQSFANALSEADKRTLAFSFFVARLEQDRNLDKRIIILDDPVSSLDINRRRETIRTIVKLADSCQQLIVFSHDAYFVRDLRDKLIDKHSDSAIPKIHEIHQGEKGYSVFDTCDIDNICASTYYYHYQIVSDYANAKSSDTREVAKAIRPLLEGYLHRRFPNRISRGQTFGKTLRDIKDAESPDILSYLHPVLKELNELNDYASDFHHDTNLDADNTPINKTELQSFSERALKLLHQSG